MNIFLKACVLGFGLGIVESIIWLSLFWNHMADPQKNYILEQGVLILLMFGSPVYFKWNIEGVKAYLLGSALSGLLGFGIWYVHIHF